MIATTAAMMTGRPGISTGVRMRREDGRCDSDRDRLPMAQARPEQGEERRRRGGVESVRARVADHVSEERAGEGGQVPADVDADAGDPEAHRAGVRRALSERHGRRLVDREVGGGGAAPGIPDR